uniref:Uncharacterized protein n=1 Tax=Knipowitschia caucasica TaxID=637954 RepID=A0AAV2ITU5_KNICA
MYCGPTKGPARSWAELCLRALPGASSALPGSGSFAASSNPGANGAWLSSPRPSSPEPEQPGAEAARPQSVHAHPPQAGRGGSPQALRGPSKL